MHLFCAAIATNLRRLHRLDRCCKLTLIEGCKPGRSNGSASAGGPERKMTALFFELLLGLEIKHYIADYFMQPGWILAGKGDLRQPGGYAHAGIHAALSLLVLLVFGTPVSLAFTLFVVE